MSAAGNAKRKLLMIDIPRDELACRIAEACIGRARPSGMTGEQALAQLEAGYPDMVERWRRSADAAVQYFHERINAGRQPS